VPKILTKPRWKAWENACVQKAFEEQIQHKVIAVALRKSTTSVSKKITTLGLRKQTSKPGRIKGHKNQTCWKEKTPSDLIKMREILQAHAPLHLSQKRQSDLKKRCWTAAKLALKETPKDLSISYLQQDMAAFSFSFPLDYILAKDPPSEKVRRVKVFGDPVYVSLHQVEKWALSEGFHYIKDRPPQQEISYWKDGRYFSKTQLLIYVNRLRLDRNLQPLALFEEERTLGTEDSCHPGNKKLKKTQESPPKALSGRACKTI
jgi:hypothetical protein